MHYDDSVFCSCRVLSRPSLVNERPHLSPLSACTCRVMGLVIVCLHGISRDRRLPCGRSMSQQQHPRFLGLIGASEVPKPGKAETCRIDGGIPVNKWRGPLRATGDQSLLTNRLVHTVHSRDTVVVVPTWTLTCDSAVLSVPDLPFHTVGLKSATLRSTYPRLHAGV